MPISIDEAIAVIVTTLMQAPAPGGDRAGVLRAYGCDLWVYLVAEQHWRGSGQRQPGARPPENEAAPFYDAAWELSRRGVLRAGPAFPLGQYTGRSDGDGYSLTEFGREWVARFNQSGPFPPTAAASRR